MEPQPHTPRRRETDSRSALVLDRALKPGLSEALAAMGLRVVTMDAPESVPGAGLAVLGGGHDRLDEALRLAESLRADGLPAALLVDSLSEAQARWASRLTPFVFPLTLSPGALAGFLASALRLVASARAGRDSGSRRTPRSVAIALGESVTIDGVTVALGIAERNFLFELASRRGHRLGKDHLIDVGAGVRIPARECRRRLGKRLGAELASLLVPEERREPYRLREPEEVTQACALSSGEHPATTLRITGRASARMVFLDSLDWSAAR